MGDIIDLHERSPFRDMSGTEFNALLVFIQRSGFQPPHTLMLERWWRIAQFRQLQREKYIQNIIDSIEDQPP